jgi:hypothetical protein
MWSSRSLCSLLFEDVQILFKYLQALRLSHNWFFHGFYFPPYVECLICGRLILNLRFLLVSLVLTLYRYLVIYPYVKDNYYTQGDSEL